MHKMWHLSKTDKFNFLISINLLLFLLIIINYYILYNTSIINKKTLKTLVIKKLGRFMKNKRHEIFNITQDHCH